MWLLPSPVHFFLLQFVLLLVLLLPKKSTKSTTTTTTTTGTTRSTQTSITKNSSSGQARTPKMSSKMKLAQQPVVKVAKSKTKSVQSKPQLEPAKSKMSKMEKPKSKLEPAPPKPNVEKPKRPLTISEELVADRDLYKRLKLTDIQIDKVTSMPRTRWVEWWGYVYLDLEEEFKRIDKDWNEHNCVNKANKEEEPRKKDEKKPMCGADTWKPPSLKYCEGCDIRVNEYDNIRLLFDNFFGFPRLYVKPGDQEKIDAIYRVCERDMVVNVRTEWEGKKRLEELESRLPEWQRRSQQRKEYRDLYVEIRRWRRTRDKQNIEYAKWKAEQEMKKEEEAKQQEKKKEETKQTAAGGGGQYESLIDAVGAKGRGGGQDKEGKKKPEAHYESLFNEPTVLTADTQETYEDPHNSI